jgi:uncharacterized protein YecA (UPF0149 family)
MFLPEVIQGLQHHRFFNTTHLFTANNLFFVKEALATHNTLLEEHTQPEEPTIHSETNDNIQTYQRIGEKVGRNDPCPCGSGKKYKNCHG